MAFLEYVILSTPGGGQSFCDDDKSEFQNSVRAMNVVGDTK